MQEYHKINAIFKRDMDLPGKPLIMGDYSDPVFEYLAENDWELTEKIDGTNIRVMISESGDVTFGGKTDNASIPAPLVKRLQERFLPQIKILHELFPEGACLYGEGFGAKIQNGGNYGSSQDFVLFDVKVSSWWLHHKAVEQIAEQLGLMVVPVVGRGTLEHAINLVRSGLKSAWGDFLAEGVIAKPLIGLFARSGQRIITKIKHRDFPSVINQVI